MKCLYCQREVFKTVLDNNLNSYCGFCYSPLINLIDFTNMCKGINYSANNIELFAKSEYLYNMNKNKDNAIEVCYEAAMLGNPDAIVNLGYYLENNIIKGDKSERIKKALDCYLSIAVYDKKFNQLFRRIIKSDITLNTAFDYFENKSIISRALYNTLAILSNNIFEDKIISSNQAEIIKNLIEILKVDYNDKEIIDLTEDEINLLLDKSYIIPDFSNKNDFFEAINRISKKDNELIFSIHKVSGFVFVNQLEIALEENKKIFIDYIVKYKYNDEIFSISNNNDFKFKKEEISSINEIEVIIYKQKKIKRKFNYLEKKSLGEYSFKNGSIIFNYQSFSDFIRELKFFEYFGNFYFNDIIIETIQSKRLEEVNKFNKFITYKL